MQGLPSITTNSRGENDQISFSFQQGYSGICCTRRTRRAQRFRQSRSIESPTRRYASPLVWTSRYHRRTPSESLEASRQRIFPISQGFHVFVNPDACPVWQCLSLAHLQTVKNKWLKESLSLLSPILSAISVIFFLFVSFFLLFFIYLLCVFDN